MFRRLSGRGEIDRQYRCRFVTMNKVYLDNAATTALDARVLELMLPYLQNTYGNPSSVHGYGREARTLIEKARRKVAELLSVSPSEIFFTSGATESNNTILFGNVLHNGIKHIITSPIEHHAVLHTVQYLEKMGWCKVSYVKLDPKGGVDLEDLENQTKKHPNSLVSLMHANNEIGNLIDLALVANICKENQCLLHSDTVQTIGQVKHDLKNTPLDFMVGSAHKFYGPKGVGFLYSKNPIAPFIHGGAQERNVRGGTENLHGIIGLAKALEISYAEMEANQNRTLHLKRLLIESLQQSIPDVVFNGYSNDVEKSIHKIVSITLPNSQNSDLILFSLDIEGIYVSGGSACTSGSLIGSHVLNELHPGSENSVLRFSIGKDNTEEEILNAVAVLQKIYQSNQG